VGDVLASVGGADVRGLSRMDALEEVRGYLPGSRGERCRRPRQHTNIISIVFHFLLSPPNYFIP
jgi:hypothetical protein